jgi:hypothetical protein
MANWLLLQYFVTNLRPYLWRSVKNLIRLPLGRKPVRDDRLVFYRQYFLDKFGLWPIRAITCALEEWGFEGPGAQAFQIMYAMTYARAAGIPYLYTPLTVIADPDRPREEWEPAWETTFNLGAGETICPPGARGVVNLNRRISYDMGRFSLHLGKLNPSARLAGSIKELIPEFRSKYYLNKSCRTTDVVTVAVNIRRREVTPDCFMYTETAKILRMASGVKSILESQGIAFRIGIYGQGSIADFPELSALEAQFHLDADPFWTLQELVEADILIVAKSFFSRYAGTISDGIKIYEPEEWRWPDTSDWDDWIACEEDGSFDGVAFASQFSLLLEARKSSAISRAN